MGVVNFIIDVHKYDTLGSGGRPDDFPEMTLAEWVSGGADRYAGFLLDMLDRDESDLLRLSYGIGRELHSMREISRMHKMSLDRIRQRIDGAMGKVRKFVEIGPVLEFVENGPTLTDPET